MRAQKGLAEEGCGEGAVHAERVAAVEEEFLAEGVGQGADGGFDGRVGGVAGEAGERGGGGGQHDVAGGVGRGRCQPSLEAGLHGEDRRVVVLLEAGGDCGGGQVSEEARFVGDAAGGADEDVRGVIMGEDAIDLYRQLGLAGWVRGLAHIVWLRQVHGDGVNDLLGRDAGCLEIGASAIQGEFFAREDQ